MSFKITETCRYGVIGLLITTLTACSGTNFLADRFSPNPELPEKTNETESVSLKLPKAFPSIIPQYPNATLEQIDEPITEEEGEVLWSSADSVPEIADFYQEAFASQNWEITQSFENETDGLIAQKDDLEVQLFFLSSDSENTNYSLNYRVLNQEAETTSSDKTTTSVQSPQTKLDNLKNIPEPLKPYVQDVVDLAVLSNENLEENQFDATTIINRRTYAQWLVNTYNKFYENQPAKQIHLAAETEQPIFSDVPANDPDFPYIQALAEKGFIPSPLIPNNNTTLFRPNAPLTREDLITWKVAIDLGKALPQASIENIKETWGFQDAAKIEGKALQALYADYQNGDQSNIRRAFGYTTLFQPQKPVTLAEAAATLWYFGYQGDGLSAQDILQQESTQR